MIFFKSLQIFSQEKKNQKTQKKSVIKKTRTFFLFLFFSVFSSFFPPNFSVLFSPSPLFHFWNVCVISSCFNRTWLEFVSIRLEQFFRVIKKILKGKKRRQKHFSSLCQYPPWKKTVSLVCCCISKLLHECVKKNIFLSFKKNQTSTRKKRK